MTRIAAVDCGTNSIRLLVSDYEKGQLRELHRDMEIIRLGQGVDATGRLAEEAIERARVALAGFVDTMAFEQVEDVRMVATSATRDASNRDEFFSMTAQLLGKIKPGAQAEVITGEEEAQLSFRGAVLDLPAEGEPFLVIDLGGGSTEYVLGDADGTIHAALSTQVGSVRLTERIMTSDPPTPSEIAEGLAYVNEQLEKVRQVVPLQKARTIVGCAGSFTTLAALALGLEQYDSAAIHNSRLNFSAMRVMIEQMRSMTSSQRAQFPVVHPGRADVMGSGVTIMEAIINCVEEETEADSFVISEKDILDGIVAGLADKLEP